MSTSPIVRASFHCCARAATGTPAAQNKKTPASACFAAYRGRMKGRSSHAADGATGARGTLVPVWKDMLLDTDTPVSAFARLRSGAPALQIAEFAFLLESAPAGGDTWARYTFMGAGPRGAWKLAAGVIQDWTPEFGWHGDRRPEDPFADLKEIITAYTPAELGGPVLD